MTYRQAQNQMKIALRFPNGVPAVSDASISNWMLYLYSQFPRPQDATGVAVTLSVVDANGNYRVIGTTTSSSDGFYSFGWTPDIPGKYNVYAQFSGSEAYYPCNAESFFVVQEASPTTPPTPTPTQSIADTYILPGIIAIIVAIAVGFAITLLVLRKRP